MKILITGGNNARVLKLLKAFPNHFVVLADYGEVPDVVTEHYTFTSLGKLNKESIAHLLLNFCITNSIDCIVPLHAFEIEPIAKSAVLFGEYGIEVLLPGQEGLGRYTGAVQGNASEIAVFVQGNCVFSTGKSIPEHLEPDLNGVFSFSPDAIEFKLFTI